MASWAALNAEAPRATLEESRDAATAEAQEARHASLYGRALRLQQQQKVDEASTIYAELLGAASGLGARLRYLCAKNLATLEAERLAYDAALQRFAEALALDGTDVVVWYQMGKVAVATGQLWLARQAFEAGFQVDKTFWPLGHALCDVLYAVGDGAAYRRVAQFLLECDPDAARAGGPLEGMDRAVAPEFQACQPSTVDHQKQLKRSRPAMEAMRAVAKKRKLTSEKQDEQHQAAANRAPLVYQLQQNSWASLGQLLLGAYDDVTSEGDGKQVSQTNRTVLFDVAFVEEPLSPPPPGSSDPGAEPARDAEVQEETTVVSPEAVVDLTTDSVEEKRLERTSISEPTEIDKTDDTEMEDVPQAHRRKSRRHEEKLREEHAQAAKAARENNLAYRLQVFLPSQIAAHNSPKLHEVVFRVKGEAVILESTDGEELKVFEKVLPSAPTDESADSTDPNGPNAAENGSPESDSSLKVLTCDDIVAFVQKATGDSQGSDIVSLLRSYLNQCGEWADRVMTVSGPGMNGPISSINLICLWAEKIVRGRLDPTLSATPGRSHDAAASRVAVNRLESDGLAIAARLFLLELRLDEMVYRQPTRGPTKSRKRTRSFVGQLDEILRDTQALLFDLCWLEDGDSGDHQREMQRLLARLFWLCGTASDHRGNANAAKDYFTKCKQTIDEMEPNSVIHLPNLRTPIMISSSTVEERKTGLQFSDVCTEAQEMTTTSRFDEAQGKLLLHFFPTNGHDARIGELLDDFSSKQHDEKDDGADGNDFENSSNLFELLLDSIEQSSSSKRSDKILILLVILSKLVEVVRIARQDIAVFLQKTDEDKLKITLAISAIEVTVDRLAAVIAADPAETNANTDIDAPVCVHIKRAAMAVLTMLLDPKVLLLFDSPRDVLQVIYDMENQLSDSTGKRGDECEDVLGPLLVATTKSFRTIRSLSLTEREQLLVVAPAARSSKSKKKQTVRHDRVRYYLQSALTLLAAHVDLLIKVLPSVDVKELMEECCPLLKEEEETVARRHESDKTARKMLATGAVLFLQLVVALPASAIDNESSLKALIRLVEVLHERLAQHELCAHRCFDKYIRSGSCVGESFVEVAATILSDRHVEYEALRHRRQAAERKPSKRPRKSDGSDNEDDAIIIDNDEDQGETDEEGFELALAQCFRCLYDVHIHSACTDHKSGSSIAELDVASPAKALRLARFAIPMMLKRLPRSNAQKKENLKIMFAIQRAVDFSHEDLQPPVQPSQSLLEYLSPGSLLSWSADVPVACVNTGVPGPDACLEHLWYLLGENYILLRVRRRSNLSELIELERKIKERIAFLLKDVQFYRPRRVESWMRLGRSTKELYHVVSDACALVLGRKWRKKTLLASSPLQDASSPTIEGLLDGELTFNEAVLHSSLFEKMKVWHDLDDSSKHVDYRVEFGDTAHLSTHGDTGEPSSVPISFTIEEIAAMYLERVVEFSRRCFVMASTLTSRSEENQEIVGSILMDGGKRCSTPTCGADDAGPSELLETAVDAYEECGLLLYNQLQEFAVLRHDDEVNSSGQFPTNLYSRVLQATLDAFQTGFRISQANHSDGHDVRFRLQYMTGKVLKKQLWLQKHAGDQAAVALTKPNATPEGAMACFASAELEHEEGKMDKSIVHAFYQLQAMRLSLILSEPISVGNLQLACEHFFEEADDDEDESGGEGVVENDGETEKENAVPEVKVTKDDVKAVLAVAKQDDGEQYLHLVQGWLFYNVVDALESISDEDRYFHASRYALAKAMYSYNAIVERLSSIGDVSLPAPELSASTCLAILADKKHKKKNDAKISAEIALKEMHPLFDKRRPQVVAIWLSEHVPTAKKFDELNQRQIKFDFCRLKYVSYFVKLLQESQLYARLKEIGSWVLACKEEHDVIDEMLATVLQARGIVQYSRLREYVSTDLVNLLQANHQRKADHQTLSAGEIGDSANSPVDLLVKEMSKAYVNYLDVVHSSTRLARVSSAGAFEELSRGAEFPFVYLYCVGATEFPTAFEVLESNDVFTTAYVAEIIPKLRVTLLNDTPLSACASVEWKRLLHAARIFCEDRWLDRHSGKAGGSAKPARKSRQAKTSTPTASVGSAELAAEPVPQAETVGAVLPLSVTPPADHPLALDRSH